MSTHGRYGRESRLAHSAALRFLHTAGKKKSRHTVKRSGLFSSLYVINILIIQCPAFRSCAYLLSSTGMTKTSPLRAVGPGGEMFCLLHNVGARMSAWIVAAQSDMRLQMGSWLEFQGFLCHALQMERYERPGIVPTATCSPGYSVDIISLVPVSTYICS